ncbi:unnamed protein product [Lactuca saligna]|uniref:AB hydrolase-1 domain-containing protein n=1 Tax=Lactuca saligna TaxID=75948 RepID=A0AA35VVT6_LACSI|nr:unnamed protein product [Lactuca saligna]
MGFLTRAFQSFRPPPPKICGSQDGPPITSPRIKLRDGRHLSYMEHGVPKETAKFKIIYIHGFDNCKEINIFALGASPALIEELGVYTVSFDRPGYGESDPHPERTLKSLALDIEELADQLQLGSKFYLAGLSMGGLLVWPCLKYIPHRLAGVVFISPGVNYWWPSFPSKLCNEVYYEMFKPDQWALRVVHHLPWLNYWWNTQQWFPSSSLISRSLDMFSPPDMEIVSKFPPQPEEQKMQPRKQGDFESVHRDLIVGMGKWEFDPMELENPFPNNEGSVHLWMGDQDRFVPVKLQRYIAKKLPWINYHEITGGGHLFSAIDGMTDTILTTLLNVKD